MTIGSITAHVRSAIAIAIGCALLGDASWADEPLTLASPEAQSLSGVSSSAYPNDTFGQQLAAASQGGGGPVGSSKYRPGSGRRDDWKVGPQWRATVDGVLLFRSDANLDAILAEVEPIAPSTTLPDLEFRDNFDHAAGVRLLLTNEFPQCAGYELQVGYLGVEKWMANAYFEQETLPGVTVVDDNGTPGDATDDITSETLPIEQRRLVGYESSLHALEVNFQRETRGYLKPFAGIRYIGLDETISDENRQFSTTVLGDPVNIGDSITTTSTQSRRAAEVDNDLIGFQGGLRLDMWQPTRRLHLNGFMSAGVFCNIVDRNRITEQSTSITTSERVFVPGTGGAADTSQVDQTTNALAVTSTTSADGTRIAFVGEAALAATWRLSSTTALRGGYQVFYVHGVELAENLWTAPPPVTAVEDELFLHGWFAGLEYRR